MAALPQTADYDRRSHEDNLPAFESNDVEDLKSEVERIGATTVLEFGPGDSTEAFAQMGCHVTTLEHIDKWRVEAKSRFADNPNVRVFPFSNTMPVECPELFNDERFDLGFVDTPQGWFPAREVFPGYEDCSRYNTTIFALQRCKVVLLHDAVRPLERGTLGRLNLLGFQWEFLKSSHIGMARIWKREDGADENAISPPSSAQSWRIAARANA